jgi:hypothetical protein
VACGVGRTVQWRAWLATAPVELPWDQVPGEAVVVMVMVVVAVGVGVGAAVVGLLITAQGLAWAIGKGWRRPGPVCMPPARVEWWGAVPGPLPPACPRQGWTPCWRLWWTLGPSVVCSWPRWPPSPLALPWLRCRARPWTLPSGWRPQLDQACSLLGTW